MDHDGLSISLPDARVKDPTGSCSKSSSTSNNLLNKLEMETDIPTL